VIVGAGFAGIRAAMTLIDSGVTSVLVLEANEYIGGRVKSINLDSSINVPTKLNDMKNVPIDMGAEWIYSYNDMEDYLLETNGYLDNVELYSGKDQYLDLFTARYYLQSDSNGIVTTQVLEDDEVNELRDSVWKKYLDFRIYLLENSDEPQSVFSAAEKFKGQLTSNKDLQYFNLILNAGEIDYTADTSELNLDDYKWHNASPCDMTYMSQVGVGFGNIAADILTPYMSNIKINSKVTEINYEDPDLAIILYTENGVPTQISARTVLVTASLGVLKAGTINFVPSLPDWKQEVIDNMGFGVMNKWIGMWSDENAMIWPADETWFELITPDDESTGKWTTFFNPTQFKGCAPTLIGWIGGDEARAIEMQTDEEITDDVMKNLQALFPGISRPDRVLVSRWGQEPNVLGTYTYKPVGRDWPNDATTLRRNVGRIRFAGESTDTVWYGTTYGGWKTGEEEAQLMVEEIASLPTRPPAPFLGADVPETIPPTKQPVTTSSTLNTLPADALDGVPNLMDASDKPITSLMGEDALDTIPPTEQPVATFSNVNCAPTTDSVSPPMNSSPSSSSIPRCIQSLAYMGIPFGFILLILDN